MAGSVISSTIVVPARRSMCAAASADKSRTALPAPHDSGSAGDGMEAGDADAMDAGGIQDGLGSWLPHRAASMCSHVLQSPVPPVVASDGIIATAARGGRTHSSSEMSPEVVARASRPGVDVTRSEALMIAFIVAERLPHAAATKLLHIVKDKFFSGREIRFSSWNHWVTYMTLLGGHGLHAVDLTMPAIDGSQQIAFYYRSAWDVAKDMIQDPSLSSQMLWSFEAHVNSAGERVFDEYMSGRWVEAVYNNTSDPAVTFVFIIMGSDATQCNKRISAHPFYVTMGNLRRQARMTRKGWRVAGFVPEYSRGQAQVSTTFEHQRRARQIFNACAWHVLKQCNDVCERGGEWVRDAAHKWRRIMPVFGLWATDRQEHELITQAYPHHCFHCDAHPHVSAQVNTFELSRDMSAQDIQSRVLRAAATGMYGADDEWKQKCAGSHSRPFMHVSNEQRIVVSSQARYVHCARHLHFVPEPNLLWNLCYADIYTQCRDDPLHMVFLGIYPHVQAGLLSKYITVLHPEWAVSNNTAPGHAGMQQICKRLETRLARTGVPGVTDFVASSFGRALQHRENAGHWTLKWSLTGKEHALLFGLLVFCVQDLVLPELTRINAHRPSGQAAIKDPSSEIVMTLGRVLEWYALASAPSHCTSSLRDLHEQGLLMMAMIQDVFPERNARIPTKHLVVPGASTNSQAGSTGAASDKRGKQSVAHEVPSDSESVASTVSSADSAEPDRTQLPRADAPGRPTRGSWCIPKMHAVGHVASGVMLFGRWDNVCCHAYWIVHVRVADTKTLVRRWDNCSAAPVEAKHLDVKADAAATNQKHGWLVQMLLREKRLDDAAHIAAVGGDDANEPAHREGASACQGDGPLPIWTLVVEWQHSTRTMGARCTDSRRTPQTLELSSLASPQGAWTRHNPSGDMAQLPYAIAKYVQDRLWNSVEWIPAPSADKLDMQLLHRLMSMVLPWQPLVRRRSQNGYGQLAIYNSICIGVSSHSGNYHTIQVRAHPCSHLAFHGRTRMDWVMFVPPWCDKRVSQLNLAEPEDFDRVSYGKVHSANQSA